ncbi:MAG: urease accessory protein UreE [Desmonostoc vinosum HA7617-LM4]|jgi:urease accessory protein|nr:urease accessory protein UreE [Desmonostoc vinosum HA7617-LM4]
MIELAETYLGNITENASLSERIEECLEVYLSPTDSRKGRIHTRATSGTDVGIVKSRDWSLQEGDIFVTQEGKLLLIHLQEYQVMVLSFTEPVSNRVIDLIHLGHVLGNHHWPIIVHDGKIYVELVIDAEVIEATIRNFAIPDLQIDYEWRSPKEQLNFSQHAHKD